MRKNTENGLGSDESAVTSPTITTTLLTRKEVAKTLGVHTETVKRKQRDGILPAVVLNSRCVRYRLEDVQRLINEAFVDKRSTATN